MLSGLRGISDDRRHSPPSGTHGIINNGSGRHTMFKVVIKSNADVVVTLVSQKKIRMDDHGVKTVD